jgi:hypothetical protein
MQTVKKKIIDYYNRAFMGTLLNKQYKMGENFFQKSNEHFFSDRGQKFVFKSFYFDKIGQLYQNLSLI